jgi:hypothetical protein
MPYDPAAINLDQKFGKFSKHWSPHIVAQLNDLHVKAAKVRGEFVWHRHEDTDELFFVHKGTLTIKYRDRDVVLRGRHARRAQGRRAQAGRRRGVPDPADRARRHAEHRRCRRRSHGDRGAVDLSRTTPAAGSTSISAPEGTAAVMSRAKRSIRGIPENAAACAMIGLA